MLREQILIEIGPRLLLGPKGEELYARRNYLELYSVFEAPPVIEAKFGPKTVGYLDRLFLMQRQGGTQVVSLGGRSWEVLAVDWRRQACQVRPTGAAGRSAWTGAPLDLGWELCQAMREVATDDRDDAEWTGRATQVVHRLREELKPALQGARIQGEGANLEWWSFAGLRANALLAAELEARVGGRITWDNLRLTFHERAAEAPQAMSAALEGLRQEGLQEEHLHEHAGRADRGRFSKFQPCLPPLLEHRYLAERLYDLTAASAALGCAAPPRRAVPDPPLSARAAPHAFGKEPRAERSDPLSPGLHRSRQPRERSLEGAYDRAYAVAQAQLALTEAFAGSAQPDPSDETAERKARSEWTSRRLLLDPEEGGLVVEVAPLAGLPRFVKELTVRTGEVVADVLSSNLRSRSLRVPIPPAATPTCWFAPGFEELLEEDLARIQVPALSLDRPTLFRVRADGLAVQLDGLALARTSRYRLLVPPGHPIPDGLRARALGGDGWRLVEPGLAQEGVRELIEPLGCTLRPAQPTLSWLGSPPARYDQTPRGEDLAVFAVGSAAVLRVAGLDEGSRDDGGDAGWLTIFGPAGFVPRALAPVPVTFFELDLAAPGDGLIELVPRDTSLERSRLVFQVVEAPEGRVPRAAARVVVSGERLLADDTPRRRLDLRQVGEGDLRLEAPPLWPVQATWRGWRTARLPPLHADRDGRVAADGIVRRIGPAWLEHRKGELAFELGELGRVRLEHAYVPSLEELFGTVKSLLQERSTAIRRAGDDLRLLRRVWLEPLLEALGYELRALGPAAQQELEAPAGCAAYVLCELVRREDRFAVVPTRLLVQAAADAELRSLEADAPAGFGRALCEQTGLAPCVLTDGLRWTEVRPERARAGPLMELERSVEDVDAFEAFLWRFQGED